jgi:hypothetical protein
MMLVVHLVLVLVNQLLQVLLKLCQYMLHLLCLNLLLHRLLVLDMRQVLQQQGYQH